MRGVCRRGFGILALSMALGVAVRAQEGSAPATGDFVPPSSEPHDLTVVGNLAYFSADDGEHGRELWVTDGTEAHTHLVGDFFAGASSSDPKDLKLRGREVLCTMAIGGGRKPSRSDGPNRLTTFKDLDPQHLPSNPVFLATTPQWIYFAATTGPYGRELWRTDGTDNGTVLVKDLLPGPDSAGPGYYGRCALVGDEFYFLAGKGEGETGLWRTNGTEEGTVCIVPVHVETESLYGFRGRLYFNTPDPKHGRELWVSDGTAAGTHLFMDINPGLGDSIPTQFHSVGDFMLFQASDGEYGKELWRTDGTAEGTKRLKDLVPGAGDSNPGVFTDCGGRVFFVAWTPRTGKELWVTDGTPDGTRMVKDIWRGQREGDPYQLYDLDGTLYFSANDGVYGEELWRSDGTEQGTRMVKDICPGAADSSPYHPANLGGVLLFAATDATQGRELWRSDGTDEGTRIVKDIYREPYLNPSSSPTRPTVVNDRVFFVANDIEHGAELWSVGKYNEVVLVRDIFQGQASSSPDNLTAAGDFLFFRAEDGVHGTQLWRSDGTEGGTVPLTKIDNGPEGCSPKEITPGDGGVYFVATDTEHGEEIWWADATGARFVADVRPGPPSSSPHDLVYFRDRIFFAADDGVYGEELWNARLTTGAGMVKDILTAPFKGAALSELTVGPQGVYFIAADGVHGRQLWFTDGTRGGTMPATDLHPALPFANAPAPPAGRTE